MSPSSTPLIRSPSLPSTPAVELPLPSLLAQMAIEFQQYRHDEDHHHHAHHHDTCVNELEDIKREVRADGDKPFLTDRNVLRQLVEKKMKRKVVLVRFLSSGTFHKAFIVQLDDGREIVARIARRFMPTLKTESEVATINYLREHTNIPVPYIYHFNSNPYNKLGGEYIFMSKAPGEPLSHFYSHMSTQSKHALLKNLASLLIPLFAHRFAQTGSLYQNHNGSYIVGPMISWPFFGEGRGEHAHLDRGPWPTETAYVKACAQREINGVKKETQGRIANPHRPHLPPESRRTAVNSDDESSEESEDSSEEDEDFYADYRRTQRASLLVAHNLARVQSCEADMNWFVEYMTVGLGLDAADPEFAPFSLLLHDLSVNNIFVDPEEPSKITCIIDFESTTVRPLWHCAQLPAFLASEPNSPEAEFYRREVGKMGEHGERWVRGERERAAWRRAHKVIEWDGWEEGLVQTIFAENRSE